MNLPASLEGHDRLRLFIGLPVPPRDAEQIAGWVAGLDTSGARPVRVEDLHLTVAFLGHRPRDELDPIAAVLDEVGGWERPLFPLRRYRETRSVGMLVLEDEGGHGAAIAEHVQGRLEELGVYRREKRDWLPHVTVLRFRAPPRLRPPLPELGPVSPSEAAAYLSVLRSSGAQYSIVHKVALGR